MKDQKNIDALNKLVEINNDRVEGYETASKEAQTQDLKNLFSELRSTSTTILDELKREITSLGGTPVESTKISGKFFRTWMDFKAALTGNDRHAILVSCEFGEDEALKVYDKVLENEDSGLTTQQLEMIRNHRSKLRADHDKIKSLRDAKAA